MEVLSKLLWLTSNASDSYHREVPANTLFCCSNHPKAAEKLIRNQFYRLVLEKYEADTERRLESSDSKEPILAFTSAIGWVYCKVTNGQGRTELLNISKELIWSVCGETISEPSSEIVRYENLDSSKICREH